MYLENSTKFTAVLNGSVPIPRLMNALGHATAGLAARLGQSSVRYLDYVNDADGFHACIAEAPLIVLKARNGGQLSTLRSAAAAASIPCNVFVSAMVGPSADEQIARTRDAVGPTLEYWAVVLFGDAVTINPLTRKFSLFNVGSSTEGG